MNEYWFLNSDNEITVYLGKVPWISNLGNMAHYHIYVQGKIVRETEKAICISSNDTPVWFPKSVLVPVSVRGEEPYYEIKPWFRKRMEMPREAAIHAR